MTPKDTAELIAKVLDSKKGTEIRVLDTEAVTTLADYFVICTATSRTHIKALADETEKALKEQGIPLHHMEGYRGGTWVLLDFASVVVHLFSAEARSFYCLERLWNDAVPVSIPGITAQ